MTGFWRGRRGARAAIGVAAAYALALHALLLGALGARLAGPPDAFAIVCAAAGAAGDPAGGHDPARHGTACILACAQAGAAPLAAAPLAPVPAPAPAQDVRFAVRQDPAPALPRAAAFDARGPPRLG